MARHLTSDFVPELRHDAVADRYVIIAPERANRPRKTTRTKREAPSGDCPFCEGNESETPPEVARTGDGEPNGPGWRVRVVPNKYPFADVHEVVVLSPEHDRSLAGLNEHQAREVFFVLRDRMQVHYGSGHSFVQVAINHGAEAGASLPHPHAQVVALDLVPPALSAALSRFADSDPLRKEEDDADFVVVDGPATAWCPHAGHAPFEMRVAHNSAGAYFGTEADDVIYDVSDATRQALQRLDAVAGDPPYNLVLHSAPADGSDLFRWYLEITPRTSVPAGFEMGSGIWVNSLAPESAAEALRNAI